MRQLLFTLIALPAVAADYQVHLVDPPITDHAILADGPLPPVCRPIEEVELHGCRGQFLPLAFVVSASKPLEEVDVEVDRIRGSGRDWPAGAVDVRVVKDYYRNTVASRWAVMPSLLVHDDSFSPWSRFLPSAAPTVWRTSPEARCGIRIRCSPSIFPGADNSG